MPDVKKWYLSRTLWTNGIIVVLAFLGVLMANGDGPLTWGIITTALVAALNMALRLTTSTALTRTDPPLGEQPAYRAAHDAGGDPDRPNGGHPHSKRAAPAPDHAPDPAAGAPSLAEKLAAEMGLEPEEPR